MTEADLIKLQQKQGLTVHDPVMEQKINKAFGIEPIKIPTQKRVYSNKEKSHIEWVLIGLGIPFAKEFKFLENRKFRFDWAIVEKKIFIEYEGIYSEHSGHTSMSGYTNNCSKYNLATIHGWKALRYTSGNYMSVGTDMEQLLK